MTEEKTTEGSTTINQYPNTGWGGAPYGGFVSAPAYGYGAVPVAAYPYAAGGIGDMLRGWSGNINLGGGTAGKALGTVGTVLGGLALLNQYGFLGGRGPGGPGGGCPDFVTQRELGLVRENSALMAENGSLKSKIYTDEKITDVTKFFLEYRQRQEIINAQTADEVATLKAENARLQQTVNQMTGVIINPMVLAPSQAVLTQAAAAKATATTGTGS